MSEPRMAVYLARCSQDAHAALELYAWNSRASATFWETLGHLEVALRNALSTRLALRYRRLQRRGSWLENPPIARLHEFRNRLAHHEPIWNKELVARQQDIYDVLGYLDTHVHTWVTKQCRISEMLLTCPIARPHP